MSDRIALWAPLPSYKRKLRRARLHLRGLDRSVARWSAKNPNAFSVDVSDDPGPGETFASVRYNGASDPPDISPIIGDALQNMWSALDHLARELATAHGGPLTDAQAQEVAFPVIWDRARPDVSKRRLGRLHSSARAAVEGMQPYHLGTRYRDSPIWLLNELARIDRHRSLWAVPSPVTGTITLGGENVDWDPEITYFKGEEHHVAVPIDESLPIQLRVVTRLDLKFLDGPLMGESVPDSIRKLHDALVTDVVAPLERVL